LNKGMILLNAAVTGWPCRYLSSLVQLDPRRCLR
jgi:hypothetical protein